MNKQYTFTVSTTLTTNAIACVLINSNVIESDVTESNVEVFTDHVKLRTNTPDFLNTVVEQSISKYGALDADHVTTVTRLEAKGLTSVSIVKMITTLSEHIDQVLRKTKPC